MHGKSRAVLDRLSALRAPPYSPTFFMDLPSRFAMLSAVQSFAVRNISRAARLTLAIFFSL